MEENTNSRAGLMSTFKITCSHCGDISTLETSTSLAQKGRSFDCNRRAVYHSIESGSGYEGLSSFCAINNMPCLSRAAYYKQVDIIADTLKCVAQEELVSAGQRLRELVSKETGQEFSDTDVIDVAVSFDGTWAKRGFTSLTGVVFAISVDTGEVLDYHVLSKACQKCARKWSQMENDEEFEEWRREHVATGQCDINFDGSSPAMEVEGATILWGRSVELHKLYYRWMICDGDSKAFNNVENTYKECTVEKLDCVGHVQKMARHLMNLKSRTKGPLKDGKPVGGQGRLTEVKIKKLQKYYGLAIRQNTISTGNPNPSVREVDVAVYAMKKNIIAILYHSL